MVHRHLLPPRRGSDATDRERVRAARVPAEDLDEERAGLRDVEAHPLVRGETGRGRLEGRARAPPAEAADRELVDLRGLRAPDQQVEVLPARAVERDPVT